MGHVSHSEGWNCADKWQYVRAQERGGPALSTLPELGARFFKGARVRGVAPTGSLFIDMPQFVTSGSPERWAMCPMFALAWPIVCHRNPRWPGALTLEYLWARLSTIT